MKHWFIDANVLIDFLADRQPFAEAATDVLRLAYAGEVRLYAASLSFSNAFYLVRRSLAATSPSQSSQLMQQLLRQIKPWFAVVAVDDAVITEALQAGLTDFEDAIQLFAAQSIPAIELLVTRNGRDFRTSKLPVSTPTEAVQSLGY